MGLAVWDITIGFLPSVLGPCGCLNSLSKPIAANSLEGLTCLVESMLFGTMPPVFIAMSRVSLDAEYLNSQSKCRKVGSRSCIEPASLRLAADSCGNKRNPVELIGL